MKSDENNKIVSTSGTEMLAVYDGEDILHFELIPKVPVNFSSSKEKLFIEVEDITNGARRKIFFSSWNEFQEALSKGIKPDPDEIEQIVSIGSVREDIDEKN